MGILEGKSILVTGVLTDQSIAFHVARLAQEQGVGRRGDEGRGLEVPHDLDLPRRVAAGRRDDRGADPLRAVVQAERAREEAVPEGDLDHVVLGHPAHGDDAGDQVAPRPDVVARIADNGRRTRRRLTRTMSTACGEGRPVRGSGMTVTERRLYTCVRN